MNDELHGQLTSEWVIPTYAQNLLWIETESELVQTAGPYGLFELNTPASTINVRWAHEDGPILACLRWQVDTLEWDGIIKAGGYVDSIHISEIAGISSPVMVAYMGGKPLKSTAYGYPDETHRTSPPYGLPNFHSALVENVPDSVTMWIIPEQNIMSDSVQTALIRNLRLHLYGRLAPEQNGWHTYFSLPLVLSSVTVFGP